MLVDVHCHLTHEDFNKDRDKVIERSEKADVKKILASGSMLEDNKKVLALADKYKIVEASLGLYPLDILKVSEEEFQKNLEFIKKNKNKVICIGEVGLDFVDRSQKKQQIKNFEEILSFTEKLKLPMLLHTRKAEKETLDLVESSKLKKVIFHMFTGNFKIIKRIEDNGYFLSIPPIIKYASHFQILAERISINQLFTETDAPYLSPDKEKRNEPRNVLETIKKISEIKKLNQDEVAKNIFMNYQKVFL